MLGFGAPLFLLGGACIALVPVLLHLLVRRPPERAPLPTARFLDADIRTHLRFTRRPTNPLLLALRVLFVVLLAAAAARPVWAPRRTGTPTIVLLDRGAAMAGVWADAIDSVQSIIERSDGVSVIAFDTAVETIPMRRLAEAARARPSESAASYAVAFHALADAGRSLAGSDSAIGWLVTVPRWGAWPDGFATLRRAAWPGGLGVIAFDAPRANPADAERRGQAVVVAPEAGGRLDRKSVV